MENWVSDLFDEIQKCDADDSDFTLTIDRQKIHELAEEIRKLKWIEIY